MKIPWNLDLGDKTLQKRLVTRLSHFLKPLVYSMIIIGTFVLVGLLVNSLLT